jgi:AraC family transcriptional regulator of adaptative response/methylated-DNA-[protein]-cysteine methyltransferase
MAQHDYDRIEHAIRYLDANFQRQPDLDEVARAVGLSRFHFGRLFRRWAGISPKRFLQAVTLTRAKALLLRRASVLDTALDVGLSGPARLHDLFIQHEALSPGQFKERGLETRIEWGLYPSPFGSCLLAGTERGLCRVAFLDDAESALAELRERWPLAELRPDRGRLGPLLGPIFAPLSKPGAPRLHLYGTNFQIQVWRALLAIPFGQVASYADVARALGRPGAGRAVGGAVGRNPLAVLIPCHRVILASGALGDYRWGAERKRALLAWEAAIPAQAGAARRLALPR